MEPGLVTVIMIFLDGEEFMEEAIQSVLAQTYGRFEFLLCDDGSSDLSPAIAARHAAADPARIRVLEHPGHVNKGMSATRNLGIAAARGEFVCFIDADDVWLPGKLAEQVEIMRAHPGAAMLAGRALYWRSWEGGRDYHVQAGNRLNCLVPAPEALARVYPLGKAPSPCPSEIMVRLDALRRIGGFEESFRGFYEDQAFFAKVYLQCSVYFSDHVWLKYRQHAHSCSSLTRRAGDYGRIRRDFLAWFEGYVATKGVASARIRAIIHRANFRYRRPLIFHAGRLSALAVRKLVGAGRRAARLAARRVPADAAS